MTFNTGLAVKVLARIELASRDARAFNLPGWDQHEWGVFDASEALNGDAFIDEETGELLGTSSCGTAMCFAGHVLSERGIKLQWYELNEGRYICDYTQDGVTVSGAAMQELGLDQAGLRAFGMWNREIGIPALFDPDNSLADLYADVADLAGVSEESIRERVQEEVSKMTRADEHRVSGVG